MAAKKKTTSRRISADTEAARQGAALKKLGSFYSGKGSGSADTQAARGATRRSDTFGAAGSEGKKKPKRKNASEGPKRSSKMESKEQRLKREYGERSSSARMSRMYKERVPKSGVPKFGPKKVAANKLAAKKKK